MFRSMTAFARYKNTLAEREITIEIKSVNNRFLECQTRLPRAMSHIEQKIKPYLTECGITRGKVDVNITVNSSADDTEMAINHEFADKYVSLLREMKETYGLAGEVAISDVVRNSDVFTFRARDIDEEKDWEDVKSTLSLAVEKFLEARATEGQRIQADIEAKLCGIKATVEKIKEYSESDIDGYRVKLEEKLRAVLADNNITIDESRILTECAIYADRAAIDEEIVRLGSHFVAFDSYMQKNEPVGRSIDFLLQEMNREINTIGSKCQNSEIAHLVVSVKTELEKIREQIQNIE